MQSAVTPLLESDNLTESVPDSDRPTNRRRKAEIKIAYIGGGSREWAVKLIGDLALTDRLTGTLALYDIDLAAATHNQALAREIFAHPAAYTRFHVTAEANLEDALRGADFVIISIEPGPTEMRRADLEIPARYGILQTVGDTTGPGGILRGLRSVPIFRQFAQAIMACCPEAWVINYTNPMAVCTAALYAQEPKIKAFGCCHEVFETQKILAGLVEKWFQVERPDRAELELEIAGVNHFTWATEISWRGHDLMPRLHRLIREEAFFENRESKAEKALQTESWFTNDGLVAFDLLRRFGALGAAGDRHLVEFVPWYLSSEKELHRWGIIRTPYSWRLERSRMPRIPLGNGAGRVLERSGEEGVQQIEALLGLRSLVTNVNLPNRGQLAGFPEGAIVETNAVFRHDSVRPIVAGELPVGAAMLVRRAVEEQSLTLQASIRRDLNLAFQALLAHPRMHLPVEKASAMLGEMIEATRERLPGHEAPDFGNAGYKTA